MGIHGSFCPKLQPRASQRNDEKQNLDPAIGLSALFEVESTAAHFAAESAEHKRSLHACVFLTADDPFDLCPEPPCGMSLMQ